jgi:hypothetical protein
MVVLFICYTYCKIKFMKPLVNQKSLLVLLLSVFFQFQAFSQSINGPTDPVCPNTTIRYTFSLAGCAYFTWGPIQGSVYTIIGQGVTSAGVQYIDLQFPHPPTSANTNYRLNADYICGSLRGTVYKDISVRSITATTSSSESIPCTFTGLKTYKYSLPATYGQISWTTNTGWPASTPRITNGTGGIQFSEIDFTVNNANSGYVRLSVTSAVCPNSLASEQTYNITRPADALPAPSFQLAPPSQCLNQNATFSVRPYPNAVSYVWSSDQPTTKINGQTPPVTVSGTAGESVTVSEATNHYRANISVKAITGCGESPTVSTAVLVGSLEGPTQMYLDGNPVGVLTLDRFGSHSIFVDPVYGATTYQWVVSDNLTIQGGQGTNAIDLFAGGRLGGVSVSVQPFNSCAAGAGLSVGGSIVGGGPGGSSTFDIYPNPAVSDITIRNKTSADHKTSSSSHDIRQVRIYDNAGKLVKDISYPKGSKQVNMAVGNLTPGIYHLEIVSDIVERKKIVIQR